MMPSREEGLPIVGLEFLAAGKPLICTTSPAFDRLYEHGVNSLRVRPEDAESLADALRQAAEEGFANPTRGDNQRLEQLTWPVIAGQYLELFDAVRHGRAC